MLRIPTNRPPVHPGEVLREEFLEPMGLSQVELADRLSIPFQRVNMIVREKRAVTPAWETAACDRAQGIDGKIRSGQKDSFGEAHQRIKFPTSHQVDPESAKQFREPIGCGRGEPVGRGASLGIPRRGSKRAGVASADFWHDELDASARKSRRTVSISGQGACGKE